MEDTIKSKLGELAEYLLDSAVPAVIIFVTGMSAVRFGLRIAARGLKKSRLEQGACKLIIAVARAMLYGLLGLITASRLEIDVTGVVALASVLTLALSLSLQNALANVIGGFTLLYTKPFSAGDFVEMAGQSGVVKEVGLTYTKLATTDNKIVSIPNSAVVAAQIVNYTVSGTRRVEVCISVEMRVPAQQVLKALRCAGTVPTALGDKTPFAAVSGYGETGVNYVLHVWSAAEYYWDTLFAVNEKVKSVFEAEQIPISYPHVHVHLEQ